MPSMPQCPSNFNSFFGFQTNKDLEAQKALALQQLETQVDELSQLIKEKLIGKEVVL